MSKLENNTASLQAMAEKINGVNNEVNAQATTIAEISALLEGKSVPSNNEEIELSEVHAIGCQHVFYVTLENGQVVTKISEKSSKTETHHIVACKDSIVICGNCNSGAMTATLGCENLLNEFYYSAWHITGLTASMNMMGDNGGGVS